MRSATLAALIAMAVVLAACGKKGSPEPPGPADRIIFPHVYPSY